MWYYDWCICRHHLGKAETQKKKKNLIPLGGEIRLMRREGEIQMDRPDRKILGNTGPEGKMNGIQN